MRLFLIFANLFLILKNVKAENISEEKIIPTYLNCPASSSNNHLNANQSSDPFHKFDCTESITISSSREPLNIPYPIELCEVHSIEPNPNPFTDEE